MPRHRRLALIFLWLFVICFSIEIGAGLYEGRVLVPRWSFAPPQTVWSWADLKVTYPVYALNPGQRFWIYTTPATGVCALLALAFACFLGREQRKWTFISSLLALGVLAATFFYFVPNLRLLLGPQSHQLDSARVTSLSREWVISNYVRGVVSLIAWLAALRALSLSGGKIDR